MSGASSRRRVGGPVAEHEGRFAQQMRMSVVRWGTTAALFATPAAEAQKLPYGASSLEGCRRYEFRRLPCHQDASEVDKMLGRGKATLYRAGKITLNDLVDQNGRGITLEALSGR